VGRDWQANGRELIDGLAQAVELFGLFAVAAEWPIFG
jgi:hypothetical protein